MPGYNSPAERPSTSGGYWANDGASAGSKRCVQVMDRWSDATRRSLCLSDAGPPRRPGMGMWSCSPASLVWANLDWQPRSKSIWERCHTTDCAIFVRPTTRTALSTRSSPSSKGAAGFERDDTTEVKLEKLETLRSEEH